MPASCPVPGLALTLCATAILLAHDDAAAAARDDGTPEQAVARYDAAWSARDEAELQRLIAPNFIYFTSRGGEWSRDRWFAFMLSPDYRLEAARRHEIVVTRSGDDVAVASTRWTGHGSYQGRPFEDDQRCSIALARLDEAWRVVSEHCTQITPRS